MSLNQNINKKADIHTKTQRIVLKAQGISKEFPGVKALSDVNLEVCEGEVVALLGENGAGKSTLMKILSGVYSLDEGSIELEGRTVKFNSPAEAKAAGIGIIHQELNYVSTISVAENIFMGDIPKKGMFIDYPKMYKEAKKIMEKIGVDINPKMLIGNCTVAQKQLIEIAKVIAGDIKVLILDEPTSALNDVETEKLFAFIKAASADGLSILYISHKLEELFKLANRTVVLRDGCYIGQIEMEKATEEQLVSMMVGRDMSEMYIKEAGNPQEVILQVENYSNEVLKNVSFEAKRGEILGIYGLLGSGHQDIPPAIFGQSKISEGQTKIKGKKVNIKQPLDAIKHGMAYVPSERKTEGLILNTTVRNNMVIPYYSSQLQKYFLNRKFEKEMCARWINNLEIKTPTDETMAESLSGGNQQKIVLAKWLELNPEILILNEPTRGIDVGAKAEIYKILEEQCKRGMCVIMITSEMTELLAMSDRIIIMHEGRITGSLCKDEASQEGILKFAIGG